MEIIYAGFGTHNNTFDVTLRVIDAYNGGQRFFEANNLWQQWGDPAPGQKKCLYIVWKTDGGGPNSGVVREGDNQGIELPDPGIPQPNP